MNNYVLHENKIRKNINPDNFWRNSKQEFPCQNLESFSGEYYNIENEIFDLQIETVCTNQTHPNYSVGNKQDEAQIQEFLCCHEIHAIKGFHLKFKARLSWISAVLKIFVMEFNYLVNHFLEEFFSEISWKSFLSLDVYKITPIRWYFAVILSLLQ